VLLSGPSFLEDRFFGSVCKVSVVLSWAPLRLTTFYPSALGVPTWSCMRACSGDLDPASPIYY